MEYQRNFTEPHKLSDRHAPWRLPVVNDTLPVPAGPGSAGARIAPTNTHNSPRDRSIRNSEM